MKTKWNWNYLRPEVRLRFEPRDLWIGVYWNATRSIEGPYHRLDIYICVIPTLPIRFRFEWGWDYAKVWTP